MIKRLYHLIKYSVFTSREQEYLNFHKRRQQAVIEGYLSSNVLKKLQIGAQSNSISGWLNVDLLPKTNAVAYMDATQRFPFVDNSFDYIFLEHMIEHIKFEEALFMLKECKRILKPGGKVRVSTPNLESLFDVFKNLEAKVNQEYVRFYIDKFYPQGTPADPVYVVNKLFYGFGHRFIHSESSLTYLLSSAGFQSIKSLSSW